MVGDAEDVHRPRQLSAAVGRERLAVALEVRQVGGDDLTLLAERAGQDVDVVAARDVVGGGDAGGQGLVVGVGVDQEQPGAPGAGPETVEQAPHRTTAMSASSTTPPRTEFAERLRTSEPQTYSARRSARPM